MYTQIFLGIAFFSVGFITRKNNPIFCAQAIPELRESSNFKPYLQSVGGGYMAIGIIFILMSQLRQTAINKVLYVLLYILLVAAGLAYIVLVNHKYTGQYVLFFRKKKK